MADRIRLAELTAGLSIATDLAMGQPIEWALASCLLAVRLGEAAGANDSELREIYFQAMLRYIGCNAESYQIAALVGDEIVLRS
ncbi:MAG: LuxR family transcriptional regulator, partial [Dehalococcoidia bacterium]